MLYLSCLSSLTVRNEYCQAVVDDGGLKCMLDLLVNPDQNKNVVKEALRLIKTLAGNDNVKKDIQNSQGISIIINAMTKHIVSWDYVHFVYFKLHFIDFTFFRLSSRFASPAAAPSPPCASGTWTTPSRS